MTRHGEFPVEEILPHIGKPRKKFNGFMVRLGSARMRCFARSLTCRYCGIVGDTFVLERKGRDLKPASGSAHLNLYAKPKVPGFPWILMTKDHLTPLSRGGPTTSANLATACTRCNGKKGTMTEAEFVQFLVLERELKEVRTWVQALKRAGIKPVYTGALFNSIRVPYHMQLLASRG